MNGYITLLLIISPFTILWTQTCPHINFTTNDGLPTNYVYGVTEDNKGNILAYTENGVSKFDGYTWRGYGKEEGINGKDIIKGYNHHTGAIYFESFDEKCIYTMMEDTFINMGYANANMLLYRNSILIGDQSNIYMVAPNGSVQKKARTVYKSMVNDTLNIFDLFKDTIILSYSESIWHLYINGGHWVLPYTNGLGSLEFYQVNVFTIKNKTFCLILTNKSMYLHDLENGNYLDLTPIIGQVDSYYTVFYQPRAESVLIYTVLGFVELDQNLELIDSMVYNQVFKGINILNAYKDSEENLWLGSIESGIYLIPEKYRHIRRCITPGALPKSIKGLVKSVNGDIYAATDNLRVYKVVDGKMHLLDYPEKRENFKRMIPLQDGSISYSAFTKLQINDRSMSAMKENPLIDIQIDTLSISMPLSHILVSHYKIKNRYIINYFGRLYIGKKVENRILQERIYKSCLSGTNHIKFLPKGDTCFVGQCHMLYFVTADSLRIMTLPDEDYIESIVYIDDHRVILGLRKGMYLYDYVKGMVLNYAECSGVKAMDKGDGCDFYAIIDNTLQKYTIVNDSISFQKKWTTYEGLPRSRLLDIAYKDGDVYLSSETELTIISTEYNHTQVSKFVSHIRPQMQLLGQKRKVLTNVFSHDQNSFLIDHKVVHPASLGKILYQYQLKPIMDNMDTTYDAALSFYSLPSGKYTYEVRAIDQNNTIYTFDPLSFEIKKPFYLTTSFLSSLILLFITSILYYRYKSTTRLRKDLLVQKTINDLKLNAIQSQMNPHFIFNALGSIQYFIQTQNVDKADEYLSDFAILIRKILNTSTQKFITLQEELALIRLYTKLEDIRFDHKINIEIIENDGLDYEFLLPPMIVQPFIENAINHGLFNLVERRGQLTISFSRDGDGILCIVTDNGIGREAAKNYNLSKSHKPKGLKITEQKVEAIRESENLNIDITIEDLYDNGIGCGTRVRILFNIIH